MNDHIHRLILQLEDLHRGSRAAEQLSACGESAVKPLRDYLVHGRPSHIFQPRQWAVEALARIGAWPVLLEYLTVERSISDPVTRLGEEAVENTAARLLAAWPSDEVFEVLRSLAQRRPLPGVIEALGSFRRPETVPLFIQALGDDVCRGAAINALLRMGADSIPLLRKAARRSRNARAEETPSEKIRRKTAMRLLSDLQARGHQR